MNYPSNVPKKLIILWESVECHPRALERKIGVNTKYICDLINDGKEPTDKTPKGVAARKALFLPAHKRKPGVVVDLSPEELAVKKRVGHVRRLIGKMAKKTKESVLIVKR